MICNFLNRALQSIILFQFIIKKNNTLMDYDAKYDAWHKAIKQDSIESFHNILAFTNSDMEFLKTHDNRMEASFKGELRKLYNPMPIPAQILIDKDGIIIGRYSLYDNTTDEGMDKKLSEIFSVDKE